MAFLATEKPQSILFMVNDGAVNKTYLIVALFLVGILCFGSAHFADTTRVPAWAIRTIGFLIFISAFAVGSKGE